MTWTRSLSTRFSPARSVLSVLSSRFSSHLSSHLSLPSTYPASFLSFSNRSKKNQIQSCSNIRKLRFFSTEEVTEIESPTVYFNRAWQKLEDKIGAQNMCFPKEIIFLMGAPGSGKGTHTKFLMQSRGITTPPIVISKLLKETPDTTKLIENGDMISDSIVLEILLSKLLEAETLVGAIVDGFPRTKGQVECTKLIFDRVMEQRTRYYHQPQLRHKFRRPLFRMVVLYIDEETSVKRQLRRGQLARTHNEWVEKTAQGDYIEERATDFDEELIRKRYRVFQAHFETILRLKEHFRFHLIDASATIDHVREKILQQLQYQSSWELGQETFDFLSDVPIANDINVHARQAMVQRLIKLPFER
eukprot:Lithocolla_globosa_v1_NODE_2897_length_1831_cov_17.395270.p1 type:complete len:360 gc:universal NODE_2897_length_1831_cov_17.395270:1325-246(-)